MVHDPNDVSGIHWVVVITDGTISNHPRVPVVPEVSHWPEVGVAVGRGPIEVKTYTKNSNFFPRWVGVFSARKRQWLVTCLKNKEVGSHFFFVHPIGTLIVVKHSLFKCFRTGLEPKDNPIFWKIVFCFFLWVNLNMKTNFLHFQFFQVYISIQVSLKLSNFT